MYEYKTVSVLFKQRKGGRVAKTGQRYVCLMDATVLMCRGVRGGRIAFVGAGLGVVPADATTARGRTKKQEPDGAGTAPALVGTGRME